MTDDINQKLNAYIQYLKHEQELNDAQQLDYHQIRILNLMMIAHHNKKITSVGKIICHKEIASAATLHSALHKLIDKNLINYTTRSDSRIKILDLTEIGLDRYATLSNYMQAKSKSN